MRVAIIFYFLISIFAVADGIKNAGPSAEIYAGKWYEPEFGEQTLFLDRNGSCRFLRAGTELFPYSQCRWKADEKDAQLLLKTNGIEASVYMKLSDDGLMMARRKINLNPESAETILVKSSDLNSSSLRSGTPDTFTGSWEALDHSMQIDLLSSGHCVYTKGEETVFSAEQCTWRGGGMGATLIFMVDGRSRRNAPLYVKVIGERMLASGDKSRLLPRRAEIQMIRKKAH